MHVFDPVAFPYAAETFYAPAGQEIGTPDQLLTVLDAYDVGHALLVGPNSAYDTDNRCLLDLLARAPGRVKGMAVVANDAPSEHLHRLKEAGVIGVTMQVALHGPEYYQDAGGLLDRLADLGLLLDLQVQKDQLVDMLPLIEASDVALVVDHCGRPDPAGGLDQPGFAALGRLARADREVTVKLSSLSKTSEQAYPYRDAWLYVRALIDTFGPQHCVWGSDWPFLRAPERVDYGPLLVLLEQLVPDPVQRNQILWQTPRRLLGLPG